MTTIRHSVLAAMCATALVSGGPARAATVMAGSDYLRTLPGTNYNFGPPLGDVFFVGNPIGSGYDTIIQRTMDITINGAAGPIQVNALSLVSTAPVPGIVTVYVTLDPTKLALDTGTMSISGTAAGGTFTSAFDVWFYICLGAGGANGVGCGSGTLLTTGMDHFQTSPPAMWTDNNSPGKFFIIGPVFEIPSGTNGVHIVDPTPLPSTWLMLFGGLVGLGFLAHCGAKKQRIAAVTAA